MKFSAKKHKYIIVDSQFEEISNLKRQLEAYPNFCCGGIAKKRSDAVNLILEVQPKLVFLSVELFEGLKMVNSFDLINELRQYLDFLPKFISTSFSKEHAYEAIKNGVCDYLLKPLNHFEFKKMLLRFEKNQPEAASICLKSFTEYQFVVPTEILFLKADNNTTDIYLKDGSVVTTCQTLKNFELSLPKVFVRIHKSYIVNVNYITKIHFSKFQCALKFTKEVIPFSKKLKSTMKDIKDFILNLPIDEQLLSAH